MTAKEVEARRIRFKKSKEVMDFGRTLGWIARKDPELYERLKEYAEETDEGVAEIIVEALRYRFMDMKAQAMSLSMPQLLGAFEIWRDFQKIAINDTLRMLMWFWSQGFKMYAQMIAEVLAHVEEGQKEGARERVLEKFFELMDKMMMLTPAFITAPMRAVAPVRERPEILEVFKSNRSEAERKRKVRSSPKS